MALTAPCPSCGAPVVFQSNASIFAVCTYCQSTLVREDKALADIGKMAALVDDRSPLQLGAEGRWQGVHFGLIGRLQIRYSQGIWNEWHLLFDDMRTGWLSEAAGEYAVSFMTPVMEPLPAFDTLRIGQSLSLASRRWTITNIERAECVAGQGELPFKVGAGYPLDAVDLRDGDQFATIDYSETPPLLFMGETVAFDALELSNLREGMPIPTGPVAARVFRCPGCGNAMSARSQDILAIGCAACGAVVDASDPRHALISKALGAGSDVFAPRIPLGTRGKLDGESVIAIGFLAKQSVIDGIAYAWREYLLANDGPKTRGTYRWLTEYNGHWNVVDVLSRLPRAGHIEIEPVVFDGSTYRHFATTPVAEVTQVSGEFTWRVRRGETCRVSDYIAPPEMLSLETTGSNLSWSRGRYVSPETIRQAFALPGLLPDPIGVFANQPNPWTEKRSAALGLYWKLAALALAIQLIAMLFTGGKPLLQQEMTLSSGLTEEQLVTRDFVLSDQQRKLSVRNETSVDNSWLALDLLLVNKLTGEAWPAQREIAFYQGYDDGYWSEGSASDEVVFLNIPAGTYYVAVDPEIPPENPAPVRTRIEVAAASAGWSNFVIVMIFLTSFPLFAALRHGAFEARRWAESDHATTSDESDSDSDD